jgi:hypothetical protein
VVSGTIQYFKETIDITLYAAFKPVPVFVTYDPGKSMNLEIIFNVNRQGI